MGRIVRFGAFQRLARLRQLDLLEAIDGVRR